MTAVAPMLAAPLRPTPATLDEHDAPIAAPLAEPESARSLVIEALDPSPIEIDEIIRFTGLKPGEIQLVLIELDLAGRIERHPGQRVSLL